MGEGVEKLTWAALLALLLAATPALAEESAPPAYETVVRSTPLGDDAPQETRVDRERIDRSPSASVAELLEREAGLHASTGSRGERLFQIRGFDQRQVFIVIDGVPAYLPYDGALDLGKLPPALVEDVVVLRPPGSLRYGPGGMGGSVSIRTRQPGEGPLASMRFEGGRGEHYRLDGLHSHRAGPVSWLVGGGVESREAYPLSGRFEPTSPEDGGDRDGSDRRLRHLLGRVRLHLAREGWVEVTAFRVDGAWGIPPGTVYSRPRYWRINDWEATVATLVHRWRPTERLMLQEMVFVGLFDNLLDAYDDASLTTQDRVDSFHSWYHDLTAGGWARARWRLPRRSLLRLDLGARYERHEKDQRLGGSGELDLVDVGRALIFLAAQLETQVTPSVQVLAGLQSEIEAGLDDRAPASADVVLALRWDRPDLPVALGLSVARRSRTPTLRERFSGAGGEEGAGRVANPSLRPEVALHFGLDATVRPTEWLRVEATVFEAEVRDLIELVPLGAERDQFQNVERARQAGVELALGLAPARWIELELAYNYLWARSLEAGRPTTPLAERPEHLARLALWLRPLGWLGLRTTVRLVGPLPFEDPDTHQWRELGVYLAWDARLELEPLPGVRTWLQVTNLLDANYQTQYGYPEPGWQLWAGLKLELRQR